MSDNVLKAQQAENRPERIYGWLDSHLSVSRHYGGCEFNGARYVIDYDDPEQPLVRWDVFKKAKRSSTTSERP